MSAERKHLFSDVDYYQVKHAFESKISRVIDSLDPATLASIDPNELVRDLSAQHRMTPPRLKEDETKTRVRDVEVSGVDAWGEPLRGRGLRADFFVPFEGTPDFFHWTPSSFNFNRPPGTVVGDELCLSYQRPDNDADAAHLQFDADLANVRTYLETWATDASALNSSIATLALQRLESKRKHGAAQQDFAKRLGFPQK